MRCSTVSATIRRLTKTWDAVEWSQRWAFAERSDSTGTHLLLLAEAVDAVARLGLSGSVPRKIELKGEMSASAKESKDGEKDLRVQPTHVNDAVGADEVEALSRQVKSQQRKLIQSRQSQRVRDGNARRHRP